MTQSHSYFHSWVFPVVTVAAVIIGAALGMAIEALRITNKAQEYIALATITANVDTPQAEEIIKTLESAEMNRRAVFRVRLLLPDFPAVKVSIRSELRDKGVFKIYATGTDPEYTRRFLDALLGEFMLYQKYTTSLKTASIKIVNGASAAVEDLQEWVTPITDAAKVGALTGLIFALGLSAIINACFRSARPPPLPPVR